MLFFILNPSSPTLYSPFNPSSKLNFFTYLSLVPLSQNSHSLSLHHPVPPAPTCHSLYILSHDSPLPGHSLPKPRYFFFFLIALFSIYLSYPNLITSPLPIYILTPPLPHTTSHALSIPYPNPSYNSPLLIYPLAQFLLQTPPPFIYSSPILHPQFLIPLPHIPPLMRLSYSSLLASLTPTSPVPISSIP